MINYWSVGASFGSDDMSREFISKGMWLDGYADDGDERDKDILEQISEGDCLVMKSSSTKGPGHSISFTKIKGVGIITKKVSYYSFLVNWLPVPKLPMDFDGIWYAKTIEPLRNDSIMVFVDNIVSNYERMDKLNSFISILKHKKQIILQGPPGTGKTRLAKKIAEELSRPDEISIFDIDQLISVGLVISSATNYTQYLVDNMNEATIQLKISTGNIYSPNKLKILDAYKNRLWEGGQEKGNDPYEAAIAKYIYENIGTKRMKIVQFHPAYGYEDFVRGITATAKGEKIAFKTENRTLGKFAELAYKNYLDSKKDDIQIQKEKWLENKVDEFAEYIESSFTNNPKFPLKNEIYISGVDDDAFRYKGDNWSSESRILFSDFVKIASANISERKDIKELQNISKHVLHRKTYYFSLLEKFKEFAKEPVVFNSKSDRVKELKYVFIIDEINRANLPAVLGELIYALEYRNEKVESLYELENGSNELVLPPNLYIIGTMNTADRSVGHIDYAIRRRFAFVDVLPSDTVIDEVISKDPALCKKAKDLYKDVAALFIKDQLASDFKATDVQLGHSYFLAETEDQLRLKLAYEIKPILREYLKDGILLNTAAEKIEALTIA